MADLQLKRAVAVGCASARANPAADAFLFIYFVFVIRTLYEASRYGVSRAALIFRAGTGKVFRYRFALKIAETELTVAANFERMYAFHRAGCQYASSSAFAALGAFSRVYLPYIAAFIAASKRQRTNPAANNEQRQPAHTRPQQISSAKLFHLADIIPNLNMEVSKKT